MCFNSVVYVSVVCGGYLLCVCCFGAVVRGAMVFYVGLLILLWPGGFALAWLLCVSYGVVGVVYRLFGLLFCASSFAVLVVALIGCWLGWLCLFYMVLMCGTGICLFVGFMILVGGLICG